jgi:hypothetical protein
MSPLPDPAREAAHDDREALREFGWLRALAAYFGPAGWWTQEYWPEGRRGKVWNLLHGNGWRVG